MLSIDLKPEAVRRERFFGVYLRRLAGLFAEDQPKVEGCLELHFFEPSQRATGEIFQKGLTKSRRLSGVNVFSGHRSGLLEWFSAEDQLKAEDGL